MLCRPISTVGLCLILGLSLASSQAQALACAGAHQKHIRGLYDRLKIKEVPEVAPQIIKLATALIKHNADLIAAYHERDLGPVKDWEIQSIGVSNMSPLETPRYLEISVAIKSLGRRGEILIRTNGSVAFLSKSWRYRLRDQQSARHYKAVYLHGNSIRTIDQGELILSTLPDSIQLSRVMSWTERQRWLNDEAFWSNFGDRVHFAPNYFAFNGKEPSLIPFTKAELLDFHRRGELEINTYDAIGGSKAPQMVWIELGIETEFVFVGKPAIENLKPKMREELRQEILDFRRGGQ